MPLAHSRFRASSPQIWTPRGLRERRSARVGSKPTPPEHVRKSIVTTEGENVSSKTSKAVGKNGPPCPRCGRATQVRTHRSIGRKQLRQLYYYSRWFKCINNKCRTTLVVRPECIVWNPPPDASQSNGAPRNDVAPSRREPDGDVKAATKAIPSDGRANGGDR